MPSVQSAFHDSARRNMLEFEILCYDACCAVPATPEQHGGQFITKMFRLRHIADHVLNHLGTMYAFVHTLLRLTDKCRTVVTSPYTKR